MRWWSAVWKLWCLKYITYSLFQWCILSLDLKHNTYIHTYMYICIRPMHKTWEVISIGWWIFYTEKKWANLILSLASAEKVEHGMFFLASQTKVYGLQEFQNWKKLLLVSCSVWQLIFSLGRNILHCFLSDCYVKWLIAGVWKKEMNCSLQISLYLFRSPSLRISSRSPSRL